MLTTTISMQNYTGLCPQWSLWQVCMPICCFFFLEPWNISVRDEYRITWLSDKQSAEVSKTKAHIFLLKKNLYIQQKLKQVAHYKIHVKTVHYMHNSRNWELSNFVSGFPPESPQAWYWYFIIMASNMDQT